MNFFKVFIATVLGVFAAFILSFFFFFIIAVSAGSGGEEKTYIRDNSYIKIAIKGNLPYRSTVNPLDELFESDIKVKPSVVSMTETLRNAATDENIKGIWLELSGNVGSWVHYQQVRDEIIAFKENSGKWVYASTDDVGYTEAGYYLASAADSVFSPTESIFEFDGMAVNGMFYKGTLEKIGVEPIITRSGKYKSAVEPYIRENYSKESREQLQPIVDIRASVWVQALAEKSGKTVAEIDELLNAGPSLSVAFAYEHDFLDGLAYEDQVRTKIHTLLELDENNTRNVQSFDKYYNSFEKSSSGSGNAIAVLYATGEISPISPSPFDDQSVITGPATIKEIKKIKKDNSIKSVILFVDSPGGAATTSDIIWRELVLLNEVKPLYVYMGSVAASGGYYLSTAGRSIMAHPQTITGSIGVFGQFFNAKEMLNDRLGVTTDAVMSHDHADWLSLERPLTTSEKEGFGRYVDNTYETFLQRVATNRNMTRDEVHEIAQGRVWTGEDALKVGLVDELGSLDDLIAKVASQDSLGDDYRVVSFPKPKTLTEILLNSGGASVKQFLNLSTPLDQQMKVWFEQLKAKNGQVMMRMPFDLVEN